MLKKEAPLKYRLLVEKVNNDGEVKTIGDTGFMSETDRNKILFLLELMNLDLERKRIINNNIF